MVWVSLEPIILSVSSQDRPGRAEVQTHANTIQHIHTYTQRRNTHSGMHICTHTQTYTYTHTLIHNKHKDTPTHFCTFLCYHQLPFKHSGKEQVTVLNTARHARRALFIYTAH